MEIFQPQNSTHGAVWSQPAKTLSDIKLDNPQEIDAFKKALAMGYFSQYTSYRQKDLVARLVDWEIELLGKWLGEKLEKLPHSLNELAIVPDILLCERFGRIISPDLLRNLYYVLFLHQHDTSLLNTPVKNILEIGSGYGCFARVMKTYHPDACITLVDLAPSLEYAKIYLTKAFPDAKICLINSPNTEIPDASTYDFILVAVEESEKLYSRQFDIAVNIWSFGEMPNHWITHWFDLIQKRCNVTRIYLLNAFASPITTNSLERAQQGNWLLQLDKQWDVNHFEINPIIHCCPFIRNFYTGLSLYGIRITADLEQKQIQAKTELFPVYLEDWVGIVTHAQNIDNTSRPEIDIKQEYEISQPIENMRVSKLLEITEYIGYPRLESSTSSTFYRLWNDYRLNENVFSGGLLLAYLAMSFKTNLQDCCTKEEIFLIKRLPTCNYQQEYKNLLFDKRQQMFNQAETYFQHGDLFFAKQLATQILNELPQHGASWHLLALISRHKNHLVSATVFANCAYKIAPECVAYTNAYNALITELKSKNIIVRILYATMSKLSLNRLIDLLNIHHRYQRKKLKVQQLILSKT